MIKNREFLSGTNSETEPHPKTIVEIGVGGNPAYNSSRKLKEEIENGAEYIGLDLIKEHLEKVKSRTGKAVIGDIAKLPFQKNSIDEIWLLNVFGGGPKVVPWRDEEGRPIFTIGAGQYFEELARVTKPGGEVIIGEYYHPVNDVGLLTGWDYGEFGFDKEVFEGEKFKKFLERHKMAEYGRAEHKFFIVLKKRKETG